VSLEELRQAHSSAATHPARPSQRR
jgi:hypothetical protein